MATDFTWTFTSSAPPPPPPTQGPGGPVLVVTRSANPFSTYYAEILRGEGLNAFATADLGGHEHDARFDYDVVVLAEAADRGAGDDVLDLGDRRRQPLIAMRPDKNSRPSLGLTDATSTLADAYMLVNASSPAPASTRRCSSMSIAELLHAQRGDGGGDVVFHRHHSHDEPRGDGAKGGPRGTPQLTYDLAKSVIYTRQGNPAWSGQDRDGTTPIRSDNLFFGAKTTKCSDWST